MRNRQPSSRALPMSCAAGQRWCIWVATMLDPNAKWSRRAASVLPCGSGIPPSAPHTGQVAFTTSGVPTNHVCFILARFHDVPPDDTLCRVPWCCRVGLYLKPPWQTLFLWFSSCLGGGCAWLGSVHSVRILLHFWPGLTVVLLRFVLLAIFPG